MEPIEDIEVVGINDLTDAPTLAHLLKYDSIFGILKNEIRWTENSIILDGKEIKVLNEKDPAKLRAFFGAVKKADEAL
jgi:glyceraldehyde 3-phosphate dehydrogenase